MKIYIVRVSIVAFVCFIFMISLSSLIGKKSAEYEIAAIYQGKPLDDKVKVITEDGVKSASTILVPTSISSGKYVVNVTRKAANIYKIVDKDIYIETRYCYEYSNNQEVILSVESNYGYTIGKLKF